MGNIRQPGTTGLSPSAWPGIGESNRRRCTSTASIQKAVSRCKALYVSPAVRALLHADESASIC